jgi:Lactate racemase N-terminal domain
VPLLAGGGVVVANVAEGSVVLRPAAPREAVVDVAAAVGEALRFPLEGPPLEDVVRGASRVTIVIELPSLPIPGAPADPRQAAVEGASDELERTGVPTESQTLLVASGLARRPGPADIGLLVRPEFRRRFRGRVVVHDAEDTLAELDGGSSIPLRVNRALVETDAVVVVTAAETVVHGGPSALVAAAAPDLVRAAGAWSLLETAGSQGWQLAVAIERALAARTPVIGVSLVLNPPQLLATTLRGFPFEPGAADRIASSPLRRLLAFVPPPLRAGLLRSLRRELTAAGAYAGPPSVAHAEALLRAIATREAVLDEPLDALIVGIPPTTAQLPRELPNPLQAAYLGLGLALRLWRDAFPIAEGGTAILVHDFRRRFAHPTQQPYRTFFGATRFGRDPDELRDAERVAATDQRALDAYREGRTCHPLLPFADWAACQPALVRVGAVLVAGCRDSVAARQLGLVPARGVPAALEMVRGRVGGEPRVGVLLAPPYFPIRVG